MFWQADSLVVTDDLGNWIDNVICEPIAFWPNKSIKWLRVRFITPLQARECRTYKIVKATTSAVTLMEPSISENANELIIQTATSEIVLSKTAMLNFRSADFAISGLECIDNAHQSIDIVQNSTHYKLKHNGKKYLYVDIQQRGKCRINHIDVELCANLSVSLQTGDIDIQCSIRNPYPAKHPNGQWDLGDANSVYLSAINCLVDLSITHSNARVTVDDKHFELNTEDDFILHQASSGKPNWRGAIHVNQHNEVDLPFQGYKVFTNGTESLLGKQAQPSVTLTHKSNTVDLAIKQFWQHFPAALTHSGEQLTFSLLGTQHGPVTELQPGEQKNREWSITQQTTTSDNYQLVLNADYLASTGALFALLQTDVNAQLRSFIDKGLIGDNNFFAKRIRSDSFGWRHFGELFADHETSQSSNSDDFVSHYNNQYDPIYGMLIQWLKTGDERWFELADDLAKHVADIDIYHTQLDKPEYSGGLFWHTDHYVQAYTATHRTYSRLQPSDVYVDHTGGGGPGGQHCYTQGLTLHYMLTGYKPALEASLKMAAWVETLYEGDGTLVSLALAIKNRHRTDLKNVFSGQYPLDRGTGNYLNALLDRYELSGKPGYLLKAQKVICATITPEDVLTDRNLANVEETWFYTVFLQAVCRYLYLAGLETQDQQALDNHIIKAFLHYTDWMIDNEYLYLDKPEILEFPNQTWTAQDLRKVCILAFALPFLNDQRSALAQQKTTDFLATIIARLGSSSETETTRILCLLMQNCHIDDYALAGKQVYQRTQQQQCEANTTQFTPQNAQQQLFKALNTLSITQEKRSLVRRFPQLSKWLGELK